MFLVGLLGLTSLLTTPAYATYWYRTGTVSVPGCPGTTWYQQGDGPNAQATSSSNSACYSSTKIYYYVSGDPNVHMTGTNWFTNGVSTVGIPYPPGGTFAYSDHNFWNYATGQIYGYRK